MREHLENAPRYATYRSKTIQNEIIETVGDYILSKIIAEVNLSEMFSILADEAADVSNQEKSVLRLVDSSGIIREELVGFHLCWEETTGEAIKKDLILNLITGLGLSMDDCRGQVQKAVHVHCMNFCVANSCTLPLVRDLMNRQKALTILLIRQNDNTTWLRR